MKTVSLWHVVLAAPLALAACFQPSGQVNAAADPVTALASVPAARLTGGGVDQRLLESSAPLAPRAPMQRGEELIDVITANLDLDNADEQIVVFRDNPSTELPLKVAVVDFDSIRKAYLRTWEGATGATNARTFEISLDDLVGDHSVEIVAAGLNAAGERTLDVFRKTPSPGGIGLFFASILSLAVNGTIEIEQHERAESYVLGQKNGRSFPVVSYTSDPQSENVTDLVETSHFWQYASGRYIPTPPQRIPGDVVAETRLQELYGSPDTVSFERFLAGPWFRVTSANIDGPLSDNMEIIHFEPEQRRITIFDGEVQEIYSWEVSHRLLSRRLGVWVRNESITSIVKNLSVEVSSLREIQVIIKGAERGDRSDGTYTKLGEELQRQLARADAIQPGMAALKLAGLYRDNAGQSIVFEPPRFTWIDGESSESGGFAVYSLGQLVIVFKVLSPSGITDEILTYALDYDERRSGDRLLRSIVLQPAALAIGGVTRTSGNALRFEQVEIVEQQSESAQPAADIIITPSE